MQYFRFFYTTVISKHLRANNYIENLVENSVVNSTSTWSQCLRIMENNFCYFISDDISFEEVAELVKAHEINFRSLLVDNETISFAKGLKMCRESAQNMDLAPTFIKITEMLVMQFLTVCKIYKNYDEAMEYARLARNLYDRSNNMDFFKRLDIKVELHIADIYLSKMYAGRNHTNNMRINYIDQQLSLIDYLTLSFDGSDYLIFRTEYLITRYEIIRKLHMHNKKSVYKSSMNDIYEELIGIRAEMIDMHEEFEFLWGKLNYKICSIRFWNNNQERTDLEILEESKRIFEKFRSLNLKAKLIYV